MSQRAIPENFANPDLNEIIELLKSKPPYFNQIIQSLSKLTEKKEIVADDVGPLRQRLLQILATENDPANKFEDSIYDAVYAAFFNKNLWVMMC